MPAPGAQPAVDLGGVHHLLREEGGPAVTALALDVVEPGIVEEASALLGREGSAAAVLQLTGDAIRDGLEKAS
jgi:hypothetical protein